MFIFLCTWRLIPDQFKWSIAAAANVAFVVSVIVDVVLFTDLVFIPPSSLKTRVG